MPTLYRIYLNREVQGPYNLEELMKVENLTQETLVCEVGDIEWENIGSCRSIQKQLVMQPLKWGAVQHLVFNVSATPPNSAGSMWNVSNSGDFVQQKRPWRPKSERRDKKPVVVQKKSILAKIRAAINGES